MARDRRADSAPSAQALADAIDALRRRVAPQLPDIDPGDLLAILEAYVRPVGSGRRFFLRPDREGRLVP